MTEESRNLFPEFEDREDLDVPTLKRFAHEAVDWMFDYLQSPGGHPIYPERPTTDIFQSLTEPLPQEGRPAAEVFHEFREKVVPFATDLQHPGNLAYIPNSTGVVGIVADLLTSTLNQNVSLVRGGPSAAAVERQVVEWLAELLGCSEAGGVLTSGGSMGNLMGLGLARQRKGPEKDLVFYLSRETHSSIDRALRFLGVSEDAIRHVQTDAEFRMSVKALEKAVRADRDGGRVPACVIGTAGTIGSGAIDPLEEIASLSRREDLWFHIDGAYGALTAAAPSASWMRAGIAAADSISLDPHKWLFVPIDTSCLLVRDVAFMRQVFNVVPEYLRVMASESEGAIYQPMEHTLELSRRFRALRLWMALKTYGTRRIRDAIEEHLRLANQFAEWVEESDSFELSAPVMTSTVCFRYVPKTLQGRDQTLDTLNESIMHRVNEHPGVYLSRNKLDGRFTLRVCITHLRTREADLQRAWDLCQEVAEELA